METLSERLLGGDERALARAISLIEAGAAEGQELLASLRGRAGAAPASDSPPAGPAATQVVGITGSPGSGKSTLVDRLIEHARAHDRRVAVVAVDPSSPYSGGAILGDRIRMTRWHSDPGVFIRSMATRGHLGGLAAATLQVVALLEAVGFELILVETVGVGQSEVDIVQVADSTVLVLHPGAGDGVQAFKAGIMEIADLFVINKFDLPGGARLKREVRAAQELAHPAEGEWWPPILEAVASQGEGVDELAEALERHHAQLAADDALALNRRRRVRFELAATAGAALRRALAAHEEALVDEVLAGRLTADAAVERLLRELQVAAGVRGQTRAR